MRHILGVTVALVMTVLGLQAQIVPLPVQVAALQKQVTSLQATVTALQATVAANNSVATHPVYGLDAFVSINPNGTGPDMGVNGPNIYFRGANIHIVSGSGQTYDSSGLGNLIIGYDETVPIVYLNPGDRSGSHNLVVGPYHLFTQSAVGGCVFGKNNSIYAQGTTVLGGELNRAFGDKSSIVGGLVNSTYGFDSTVVGGSGGTSGSFGGQGSVVLGGEGGAAKGDFSVTLGGVGLVAPNRDSIYPQPPFPQ